MPEIHVRPMYAADLPRVVTIQRLCHGTPLDTTRALLRFLRTDPRATLLYGGRPMNGGLVAQVSGAVVGFLLYQMDWPRRMGVVLRLGVLPRHRRHGIGSRLLASMRFEVERIQARLQLQGHDVPEIEFRAQVPERDLVAQLFLRSNSFKCVWIAHASWSDGGEDVYLFRSAARPRIPSAHSRQPAS